MIKKTDLQELDTVWVQVERERLNLSTWVWILSNSDDLKGM